MFELGRIVETPGALSLLESTGKSPDEFLDTHISGDWGDVEREDDIENFRSIKHGLRIMSVYRIGEDAKIWIITEADRSSTTILLPSEY